MKRSSPVIKHLLSPGELDISFVAGPVDAPCLLEAASDRGKSFF
jgi:hypothetical protein